MVKELEAIDSSSFRSLAEIRQDELVLKGLLQKAQDSKDAVSAPVFARVLKDYTARLDALEARARPLRVTARAELAKLYTVRDQLKKALDVATMDHEELKFRLQVGELQQEDFEPKEKALAEVLAAATSDFDEVERVSKQFAEVVPPEPTPPPAPPRPVPPPPPPLAPVDVTSAIAIPNFNQPVDDEPESGTVVVDRAEMADMPEFATMAVSLARLVQQNEGGPPKVHELGAVSNIGRVAENHISIDRPEVSRNHARISMSDGGWLLSDLGSGNGTFVNGKRVKEQRLKTGDRIRIGTTEFTFEAG